MHVELTEGGYTLSLKDFLRVIWRRALSILLVAVLTTGVAVGFSIMQTPVYEASTEIIVGQEQSEEAPGGMARDIAALQQISQTVVEAVDSRVVAAEVIEELDLQTTPEAFLGNLSVQQVPETQFIQITYTSSDPEQTQKVANTVAEVSSDRISEMSPSTSAITATVWEPALEPEFPVSPDPTRNGVLALMLGLMLGVGLAFLREYLDESWQSPEEVERVSGASNFGVIPKHGAHRNRKKKGY